MPSSAAVRGERRTGWGAPLRHAARAALVAGCVQFVCVVMPKTLHDHPAVSKDELPRGVVRACQASVGRLKNANVGSSAFGVIVAVRVMLEPFSASHAAEGSVPQNR